MAVAEKEELSFEKVWKMFQETDKKFQDTAIRFQETDKRFQETSIELTKTKNTIDELGRQIGGLGNKFGSYNEALFIPSIIKLLETKFNCKKTFPNARFRDNGNIFEIDLLGISDESCYLVEIKSYLKSEGIEQLKNLIEQFSTFEKEYEDKKKYGMITATEYSDGAKQKALESGFYFISIIDEIAKLNVPDDFVPKAW